MSFQRVEVLGVIGKDAEIKTLNNHQYLSFSVAVDNGKDAQGNQRPSTWFDVLYQYNQQTQEWLVQRLAGKSRVFVSGRVSAGGYVSKQTNEVVATLNIFANMVEPLGIPQRDNTQPQAQVMPQVHPVVAQPQTTTQDDSDNGGPLPF